MFALAMILDFGHGRDEEEPYDVQLSFHGSVEAARLVIIERLLSYTNHGIVTLEDFIKEMNATQDLDGVDVNSFAPSELIDWIRNEAVGEDTILSYEIKEVPTS
jgi:PDZ domain-containing secreted protein